MRWRLAAIKKKYQRKVTMERTARSFERLDADTWQTAEEDTPVIAGIVEAGAALNGREGGGAHHRDGDLDPRER